MNPYDLTQLEPHIVGRTITAVRGITHGGVELDLDDGSTVRFWVYDIGNAIGYTLVEANMEHTP